MGQHQTDRVEAELVLCVCEALEKYKEVLDVTKAAKDIKLTDEGEALLVRAYSTKCAGCLLGMLAEKDKEKLARMVKEEMLQLRARIGKEREATALPKKLWDRVQTVLVGG